MDQSNPQDDKAQDQGVQPPAGTPPAGTPQPPAGTPPAAQPPAGTPPAGTPQPPAGAPPAKTPPSTGAPIPGVPMPGGMPGGTMPPPPPQDDTPANFQLGALFTEGIKLTLPKHPDSQFDDAKFLPLLASSISLSKAEKKRIVDAIPKLKQWQVDELMTIFEEEKKKFAQLSKRHVPQLEKLAKQHYEEWRDLEMQEEQTGKAEEEKEEADEIRKKLGL